MYSKIFTSVLFLVLFSLGYVQAQNCDLTSIQLYNGEQPYCEGNGTYCVILQVNGINLPSINLGAPNNVKVVINGQVVTNKIVDYIGDNTFFAFIVCGLPSTGGSAEVYVQVENGCSITGRNLYNVPSGCTGPGDEEVCNLTSIQLYNGEQPFCDGNGAYCVILQVNGTNLPSINLGASNNVKVVINGQTVTGKIVDYIGDNTFFAFIVCGLPSTGGQAEVYVQVDNGCSITGQNLYTIPTACTGEGEDAPCDITGLRLGGQTGDGFIGPTCNNGLGAPFINGMYRTCFYVSGVNIPGINPDYKLVVDHKKVPIESVFTDGDNLVLCVANLPPGKKNIEVFFRAEDGCTYTAKQLYDAPEECPIAAARLTGPASTSEDIWKKTTDKPQTIMEANSWATSFHSQKRKTAVKLETIFEVYPNPTPGPLTIVTPKVENARLEIFNSIGQQIIHKEIGANTELSIDMSFYEKGVYMVRIVGDNYREIKKVILAD